MQERFTWGTPALPTSHDMLLMLEDMYFQQQRLASPQTAVLDSAPLPSLRST